MTKKRQQSDLPRLLTCTEVCEMFGSLNRHVLYRLARNGQIPTVRMGRAYRFTAPALQEWIDAGGSPPEKKRKKRRKASS